MWIKYLLLAVAGLSAGTLVAGGVFALITSIGVIPRLAGKTHTGEYVKTYESSVLLGGVLGNIVMIYGLDLRFTVVFLGIFGLFAGMFVGCLATSLAESLNTTAVFSRRIVLHRGMGAIIVCVALGKLIGSMMFFYLNWF